MATKKAITESNESVALETESTPIIPKEVDPNQIIVVKNGFHGTLVYESPRTHEVFRWESFGDEQEMELKELRNVKSASKAFFENNWFMFGEEYAWVIRYLGLSRYYANAINLEELDDVLRQPTKQLKELVSKMSKGQKNSLRYRVLELMSNGEIDSIKTINALEEVLGVSLTEK